MEMNQEITERFARERPIYQALGDYVVKTVLAAFTAKYANYPVETYFKIQPCYRVKDFDSLYAKSIRKGKQYSDPYNQIHDKVGVRFVVLLLSEIAIIRDIIEHLEIFEYSKDRDHEDDKRNKPAEFAYQSLHYVVRPKSDIDHNNITIPAGTPCEVQIRTLLQHAHAEMTHDNIYKTDKPQPPEVYRMSARAIALVEATDETFEQVMCKISEEYSNVDKLLNDATNLFNEMTMKTGQGDKRFQASVLIPFLENNFDHDIDKIKSFITEQRLIDVINEKYSHSFIHRQPIILYLYKWVFDQPNKFRDTWPFTSVEAERFCLDVGITFDDYH